ncbi:diaminopropionate ammonia-lyase [Mongoliitalea lutea]|uniref:Diaminopropionate ammonia-lyase n=1 Tax=Mongoliitalea lutea TaxID=849756 RepID=A0A8J3CZB7_9BACT|nr:diaminopropionate ammonia-lyase [Mongoliitalea lutea]GHB39281.1 diaminopropionate ammonia-lyase [Mongoliitalea lutea]
MIPFFINQPSNQIPESTTTKILREHEAFGYHQSLPMYAATPMLALPYLAKKMGVGQIFIKDEGQRFGLKAFKALGASFAIHKILQANPRIQTFCTATDGNHGRAVAWAAIIAGKESVILFPKDTTPKRIQAIEAEGATVIQINGTYDDACVEAEKLSQENHWTLVQDTAWEGYEEIPAYIMAGYLTHFKELEDSIHPLPDASIDYVFLQAGVGSWAASGIYYYLSRYGIRKPKIVLVEPLEANGLWASFHAGKRIRPDCSFETIMAGLNCGLPSLSAWKIIQSGADACLCIPDVYAQQAMRLLYHPSETDPRIIAGESGAAGLAGLLALIEDPIYKELKSNLGISSKSRILFFNTEADTDTDSFDTIVGL